MVARPMRLRRRHRRARAAAAAAATPTFLSAIFAERLPI